MSARTAQGQRRRIAAIGVGGLVAPLLLVAIASASISNTDYGANFEVFEGNEVSAPVPGSVNLVNNTSSADDWAAPASGSPDGRAVITATRQNPVSATGTASICDQTRSAGDGILYCDTVKNDNSIFNGGAKESDPSGWSIITGSVTPKTDITNTYALGRIGDSRVSGNGPGPWIINGMERLPKAGDVHLDFEYNQTVDKATSRPTRKAGDLLIAYDLGGSRTPGVIHVRIFKAQAGVNCTGTGCYGYDYDNATYDNAGDAKPWENGVFAGINTSQISSGAWQSYDDNYNLTSTLPEFAFAEAKIDLRKAIDQGSICANFLTVKSRASESVTSQLKDTTGPQDFGFCGGMKVHKWIDVNADGVRDQPVPATNTADINTGSDVAGWSFSVYSGSTASGTPVCTGTTESNGELKCTGTGSLSDLQPGNYTIAETLDTSTQANTYAGTNPVSGDSGSFASAPRAVSPATKTVSISIGTGTTDVYFGNTCQISTVLTVNSVPNPLPTGFYIWYRTSAGPGSTSTVTKVTDVSTTTVTGRYASNSIEWGYGIGSTDNTSATKTKSLALTPYPACSATDSTNFATGNIEVTKFKDGDNSGTRNSELALGGFPIVLKQGTTVIAVAVTDAVDGKVTFSNLNPGSYTVHELGSGDGTTELTFNSVLYTRPAGWLQTKPASNGDYTVTVPVGGGTVTTSSTGATLEIGNTPLSTITVSFTPETSPAKTKAAIDCAKSDSTAPFSNHPSPSPTPSAGSTSASRTGLTVGTYNCTVVVTDP